MPYDIRIELLQDENAALLEGLLVGIYGGIFSELLLLPPEELLTAYKRGDELTALAFADGEAAGFISLKRSTSNPRLYELGMLSVLPRFRDGQTARALARFARAEFPYLADFDAVYMENVASHRYSQRLARRAGAVDTALLLSAMPALDDPLERLSFVLSCHEAADNAEPVYLPSVYKEILPDFFAGLRQRTFLLARGMPDGADSVLARHEYPTVGTAKGYVYLIGADFDACARKFSRCCQREGYETAQVYLPLSSTFVGYATESLCAEGFFLAGIQPFCFGGDGLIMQRCGGRCQALRLYSEKSVWMWQLLQENIKV